MNPQGVIAVTETKRWIEDFIIKLNICPFAERAINKSHYFVYDSSDEENEAEVITKHLKMLDSDSEIETSFLIFTESFADFHDYLELLSLGEECIKKEGYEGHIQIASFHPKYQFTACAITDAGNFTNRSPYPMLHFLREDTVSQAIENYGDTKAIPLNNIERMNKLGYEKLKKALDHKKWF